MTILDHFIQFYSILDHFRPLRMGTFSKMAGNFKVVGKALVDGFMTLVNSYYLFLSISVEQQLALQNHYNNDHS